MRCADGDVGLGVLEVNLVNEGYAVFGLGQLIGKSQRLKTDRVLVTPVVEVFWQATKRRSTGYARAQWRVSAKRTPPVRNVPNASSRLEMPPGL